MHSRLSSDIDPQNWIGRLPDTLRERIEHKIHRRHVAAGELIYVAGEVGQATFQMESGIVRLYTLSDDGRELVYDFLRAGMCFGETSIIDGLPRAHMAQAVTETVITVLRGSDLKLLMSKHPEIAIAFCQLLTSRARRLYTIYEGVSLAALSRRMATRLSDLASTIGEVQEDGVHFPLRITQEDIGTLVVGSRQTVNRILKGWQARGLIDLQYGALVIKNPTALRELHATSVQNASAATR